MEQHLDASRKSKDFGSTPTRKAKGTREEFEGQQLEFHVWRLLEVSFLLIRGLPYRKRKNLIGCKIRTLGLANTSDFGD